MNKFIASSGAGGGASRARALRQLGESDGNGEENV